MVMISSVLVLLAAGSVQFLQLQEDIKSQLTMRILLGWSITEG